MKINAEKQHGQIVWARISKKSKLWAAMIISVKKMNLAYFEDQPGRTCVWWLVNNTMSQLNNDLIYEFKSEIKNGMSNLSGQRKENVKKAIQILSSQLNFVIPKHEKTDWTLLNFPIIMKGKRKRNEEFTIPDDVLKTIIMTNNNIKRSIEENKEKEEEEKREKKIKIDVSQISKMKNQYCLACRIPSDELEIKHPIFTGFLCSDCFTNGKDIILPIAQDNANDGCCVCLTQKETLVLCSFCIRAFCNECLEFYCGEKSLEKILDEKIWKCLACNTIVLKTSKLVPRSTKEQLRNIYNLYPAHTENKCAKEKIQEIHVMNLKDIQNNAPKALQNLKFPFKILEVCYLDEKIQDNISDAKLVVQYYPNQENYDKEKFFNRNDCMKKFFSFLQIKNKMEALHNDGKTIYWAFETSAAIKVKEQKTISRFVNTPPIIIGMDTDDLQQRSRFIWTNITILDENIEQFTVQHIYLHKIPKHFIKRAKYNADNIDMPWCYTSIYLILSSFIKNHIQF